MTGGGDAILNTDQRDATRHFLQSSTFPSPIPPLRDPLESSSHNPTPKVIFHLDKGEVAIKVIPGVQTSVSREPRGHRTLRTDDIPSLANRFPNIPLNSPVSLNRSRRKPAPPPSAQCPPLVRRELLNTCSDNRQLFEAFQHQTNRQPPTTPPLHC